MGTGAPAAPVAAGGVVTLSVDGQGGVPASGVSAVVLNVTVAQPAANGYITVYPDGVTRPLASNLNFVADKSVPNLVIAPVGADGDVDLYNGSSGTVQLVADVSGYFSSGVSRRPTGRSPAHPRPPAGHPGRAPAPHRLRWPAAASVPLAGRRRRAGSRLRRVRRGAERDRHAGDRARLRHRLPRRRHTDHWPPTSISWPADRPQSGHRPGGHRREVDLYNGSSGLHPAHRRRVRATSPGPPRASPWAHWAARRNRPPGHVGPAPSAGAGAGRAHDRRPAAPVAAYVGHPAPGRGRRRGAGLGGVGRGAQRHGDPAHGATATSPSTPTASTRPLASNLNFSAGQTVPNLVIAPVGPTATSTSTTARRHGAADRRRLGLLPHDRAGPFAPVTPSADPRHP